MAPIPGQLKIENKNGVQKQPAVPRLPKILMVEDQKIDVKLVQHLVKNRYQLFSAPTAADAMKILTTEKHISLILMDIRLGADKTGAQLATELKSSMLGHIPIIGVSALDQKPEWAGLFVEYLQKPVDNAVLTAKIDKYAIPLSVDGQ